MKRLPKGQFILKRDDTVAIQMDKEDSDHFMELSASVGNIDNMLSIGTGKMPQRDLLTIMTLRKKAVLDMEKFVASVYKKYDLDDRYVYGIDPHHGQIFQTPQKRVLWRFR